MSEHRSGTDRFESVAKYIVIITLAGVLFASFLIGYLAV